MSTSPPAPPDGPYGRGAAPSDPPTEATGPAGPYAGNPGSDPAGYDPNRFGSGGPSGTGAHHPGPYDTPPAGLSGPYDGPYDAAGAVAQGDPLIATSFSDWWSKVIGVLTRSWQPLLVIQIATVVPGMIVAAIVAGAAASQSTAVSIGGALLGLVGGLIVFVVALLAQAASVYVVGKQASGEEVGAGPALSFAAGRALPLLGWGILAAILIGVGFILLVIPGIYLIVVFAASLTGVIMFERAGIGRTFSLVNPAFGQTLGRLLSFALAALVYSAILGMIVGVIFREGFVGGLVYNVLTLPVTFASVGVAVVTYASLRHRENPEVTTRTLAAELDR